MRTNPPGEDREEGKKPMVVGEPGGLERETGGKAQMDR